MSGFIDLASIVFIFKIGRKLFSTNVGLLGAFFYSISVLPIQLSHFYAVDTFLTCFILSTLYSLLLFYEKPTLRRALVIGFLFGLSLATKISALVVLVAIGTTLVIDFALLIFLKKPRHPKHWLPHLPAFLRHLIKYALVIAAATILTFLFLEPYSVIDFKNFLEQNLQQSMLTNNPFYFPYTLQYVGKIPYLYEFKNIFLWGLGPLLATAAFAGFFYFLFIAFKKDKSDESAKEIIIIVFFLTYVFVVGRFAVGFMRYMLPVYPLFCIFASTLANRLFHLFSAKVKNKTAIFISCYLLFVVSLVWPLSFMHIYTQNNTRVDATNWTTTNIEPGRTIAVEHWDDELPLKGAENFHVITLALYDPDTDVKWDIINRELAQTDYIIIASNRLYTPLQKLTDCPHLPVDRCYPVTAAYYKNLFSEKLGFKKVAEFTNYPTIPLLNIEIEDQTADESFTVNDHPKVMIFKKSSLNSTM